MTVRLQLADKLMLMLLRADGKVIGGGYADLMLGGAVVSELILRGRIDIAGPGEAVKAGRLMVRSTAPVGDELLDTALQKLIDKPGSRPSSAVRTLVERASVLHRLTANRIVTASPRQVFGLFSVTCWPTLDGRPAAQVRRDLKFVVDGAARPVPETAVLVMLLLAGGMLHKVLPTGDRRAQKASAKNIARDEWATAEIRKALQEVAAGVAAAVAAVAIGE